MPLGPRPRARGGKLDARRLLLNAATPFTLTTANPIADDALLRRPGRDVLRQAPADAVGEARLRVGCRSACGCRASRPSRATHAHVRWHGLLPPVVTAEGFSRLARIPLTGRAGTTLATIRFDKPAARTLAKLALVERGAGDRAAGAASRAEGRRRRRTSPLDAQQRGVRPAARRRGRRPARDPADRPRRAGAAADALRRRARVRRRRGADRVAARAGSLRDAAARSRPGRSRGCRTTTTRSRSPATTTVGHDQVGEASVPVRQTALFRTKGWPGLNAPATPGGDLAPFVEAAYPRTPERLLYRDEPILLAMNERFSPLAPAVDAPPTAPPERRQLLEWSMLVDQVGAGDRGAIATYSSPDWLTREPAAAGSARAARARGSTRCCRTCGRRAASIRGSRGSTRSTAARRTASRTIRRCTRRASSRARRRRTAGRTASTARASCSAAGRTRCGRSFEAEDLTALTMLGGSWSVDGGCARGARRRAARSGPCSAIQAWVHVHLAADLDLGGRQLRGSRSRSAGRATRSWRSVDAAAGRLRLERRRGGTHGGSSKTRSSR